MVSCSVQWRWNKVGAPNNLAVACTVLRFVNVVAHIYKKRNDLIKIRTVWELYL